MKKLILCLFLLLLVLLAGLILYYFSVKNKFPVSSNIATKCLSSEDNTPEVIAQTTDLIRKYLDKNENIPLTTSFIGKVIPGTKCISIQISNLKLYVDKENYLILLKNGKEYKKISPGDWK